MSGETKQQEQEASRMLETQAPPTLETSTSPPPRENPVESSYRVKTEEVSLGAAEASSGVTNLWGLSEKLDSWQVSSLPQEKVYFALQVPEHWPRLSCLHVFVLRSVVKFSG